MNLEQRIIEASNIIPNDKYIVYVTHTLGEHLRFISYIPSIRKYFSNEKKLVYVIWKKYQDLFLLFDEKPDLTICYEWPVTEEQGAEEFPGADLEPNKVIYPLTILKQKKIFDQLLKDSGQIGFRPYFGIPKIAPVQKIKINSTSATKYSNKTVYLCLHSLTLRPPTNNYIQSLISEAKKNGWVVYYDSFRGPEFIDGIALTGDINEVLSTGFLIDAAGGVVVTMSSGLSAGFYLAKVPQVVLYPGNSPYTNNFHNSPVPDYGSDFWRDLSFETELGKFECSENPVKYFDDEGSIDMSIKQVIEQIEYLHWTKRYR
jgi:hypothetical protein